MADPLRPLTLNTAMATLAAAIKVCSGIPGIVPQQIDGPFVFPEIGPLGGTLGNADTAAGTRAKIELDLISAVNIGRDEQRDRYDSAVQIPGDTYVPDPDQPDLRLGGIISNMSGNRLLVVQARCEVQADPAGAAYGYLERVRTRLRLPSVVETLESVGLAINHISDTRPADYTDDSGLTVRAAYLEIVLNAADCADDDPVTTIEQTDPPEFLGA